MSHHASSFSRLPGCDVSGAIGAAMSLVGFVVPKAGAGVALFTALCNLVVFSVTASIINGDLMHDGGPNTYPDCGYSTEGRDVKGGAAFGLGIVSFVLALVQAVVFFRTGGTQAETKSSKHQALEHKGLDL